MKSFFKYALIRLVLLGNLILLFNFVYEGLIYESDLKRHAPFVVDFNEAIAEADVLYLGDCSDGFFYENDGSFLKISEILNSLTPRSVIGVSQDGLHPGVYKDLLRMLPDSTSIKTVFVTVNIRAFSAPILLSEHENVLWKQRVLLQDRPPLLNRFLLAFKGYPSLDPSEMQTEISKIWNADTLHFSPGPEIVTLGQWRRKIEKETKDLTKRSEKLRFVENYGFSISADNNPMVRDLDELIKIAASKQVDLVFHILPEDYERTRWVIGPELVKNLEYKRDWLLNRYAGKVRVVDNYSLMYATGFAIPLPSSHYSFSGRHAIAESLLSEL